MKDQDKQKNGSSIEEIPLGIAISNKFINTLKLFFTNPENIGQLTRDRDFSNICTPVQFFTACVISSVLPMALISGEASSLTAKDLTGIPKDALNILAECIKSPVIFVLCATFIVTAQLISKKRTSLHETHNLMLACIYGLGCSFLFFAAPVYALVELLNALGKNLNMYVFVPGMLIILSLVAHVVVAIGKISAYALDASKDDIGQAAILALLISGGIYEYIWNKI